MELTQSYTALPGTFYKHVLPTPVADPQLVIWNDTLAKELQFNEEPMSYTDLLAGNETGSLHPIAQAYAGHQFGNFTMLGDGRALLLGETITSEGTTLDIQLKGSGRTPFSRGGDGRAALGPMLREYVISEAMHHLKIPTTRSLAVVYSGEGIQRETVKPGAVLTRVAKSHLRVGTFQYASQFGSKEDLQALADYTLNHLQLPTNPAPYESLLHHVISKQAELLAKWQLVGFVHGVMNTDNMAISGETIDYGPCAFLDTYNPATVFSSIDQQGRYAYGNQPGIAGWNLARFAESLVPLLADTQERAIEIAQNQLDQYPVLFQQAYNKGLVAKIGGEEEDQEALRLATEFLKLMEKHQADFTLTFRALTLEDTHDRFFQQQDVNEWLTKWEHHTSSQSAEQRAARMKQVNPALIPRNHLVQQALDEAEQEGVMEKVIALLEVLENPYAYSEQQLQLEQLPPHNGGPFVTYCGT
ncbi:hypothetical protein CQS04_12650 [Chryseomicrobium excrementi]|uniref:Protein nucleotidyltransferase YdiU n=1 Tax=Chryseomicrobium excrementi TaxID=2041346 RepID=A0A2M9EWW8_9BACL|nr:YdiU family protein [Chryseomicrobium excrementi]PJK15700.1 hypothetical protein CQS04_12650 [Chryseomicrobium excrementi]